MSRPGTRKQDHHLAPDPFSACRSAIPRLVVVSATPNAGIAELTSLIESGRVIPSIERIYPLAEVPDALRHLATHHARGKLAITV